MLAESDIVEESFERALSLATWEPDLHTGLIENPESLHHSLTHRDIENYLTPLSAMNTNGTAQGLSVLRSVYHK